ncbi:MAG TPA: ThiF family adenylyltransferase, partial [SAR202 cluster bacterium]|nr:ThiF family adenylyltransferase [SAR202 cluster bacterium]
MDRYTRLVELGWNMDLLRRGTVLVVGAGALGNEIIKNLALAGVGNVLVVDLDEIETHNLTRSV